MSPRVFGARGPEPLERHGRRGRNHIVTLGEARAKFVGKPTPRILAAYILVTLVARVVVGGFTWKDAAVAGGILAFEPFTEWLVHVHLLHSPRNLSIARKHRAHHADPRDLDILFIPMGVIVLAPLIGIGLPLVLRSGLGVALTAGVTGFSMLLVYEWTHFLIHTPYHPKSRLYARIRRAHIWHHFRNEKNWFGVTIHTADRLLGTYPDKDAVPLSPTARSLHPNLG